MSTNFQRSESNQIDSLEVEQLELCKGGKGPDKISAAVVSDAVPAAGDRLVSVLANRSKHTPSTYVNALL